MFATPYELTIARLRAEALEIVAHPFRYPRSLRRLALRFLDQHGAR